jgi:hypothetical protein
MPSTPCPFCGRKVEFAFNEMELVIECAQCEGRFTPSVGPVRAPGKQTERRGVAGSVMPRKDRNHLLPILLV